MNTLIVTAIPAQHHQIMLRATVSINIWKYPRGKKIGLNSLPKKFRLNLLPLTNFPMVTIGTFFQMSPSSEKLLLEQSDTQQFSLCQNTAKDFTGRWSPRRVFDFVKLIIRSSSRSVGHCTSQAGFGFCNFWRLILFQKTRLVLVLFWLTDLQQAEIALQDQAACNNRFSHTSNWDTLYSLEAISTCYVSSS